MELFLSCFILGFTLAALPGAVQATVFQSSVSGKPKDSFRLAFGAATMDGTLLLLSFFGVTQLVSSSNITIFVLGLFGAGYTLYLGLVGMGRSVGFGKLKTRVISKKTYLTGILLVILSPPTIIYFIGMSAVLFSVDQLGFVKVILLSICVSLGSITCFIAVAVLGMIIGVIGKRWLINIFIFTTSVVLIYVSVKLMVYIFQIK